ncbi:MAG: tRNA pseudouridine(55) synthase TruB [Ruminococcus sp.]|nr:tRNA pseudouridine(55) synthase TruB [Ruminococcus sp.]
MGNLIGYIPVNKAEGFTSFDAVAVVRRAKGIKRIGHSGTLDPMATGVLVVLIGRGTLAADILPITDKEYIAGLQFGSATDTGDRTGEIIQTSDKLINEIDVKNYLERFNTPQEISQIPPMYSAVKVNGKRLYELARKGEVIERKPRTVTIYNAELLEFNEREQTAKISVKCSSGTYIRTFIEDLGTACKTFAYMTELVRTSANGVMLSDCTDIRDIKANPEKAEIRPLENLFLTIPEINLQDEDYRRYKNGVRINTAENDGQYRVKTGGVFIGIGSVNNHEMKAVKSFVI